jgi:hypothetical protein
MVIIERKYFIFLFYFSHLKNIIGLAAIMNLQMNRKIKINVVGYSSIIYARFDFISTVPAFSEKIFKLDDATSYTRLLVQGRFNMNHKYFTEK